MFFNTTRFGDGYMINVRCEVETVGEVKHCVQSAIPEALLREQRSRQLIWHVPPNTLPISALFERLEATRRASSMVIFYYHLVILFMYRFENKSCSYLIFFCLNI